MMDWETQFYNRVKANKIETRLELKLKMGPSGIIEHVKKIST